MLYKEAITILFNETPTDYILEHFEAPTFWEFHVSAGGDLLTYRINKENGCVTER